MLLQTLSLQHFRNLADATLDFSPVCNIISGQNGAGKTSLLEAIYHIGYTRSFLTSNRQDTIGLGTEESTLHAILQEADQTFSIGIQRSRSGTSLVKCNDKKVQRTSELTLKIPMQLINTDGYPLIEDGPKNRRAFLDWGLFHMKPAYVSLWQNYTKLLTQRNQALKQKLPLEQVCCWDQTLVDMGEQLSAFRIAYLSDLSAFLDPFLKDIPWCQNLRLDYHPGYDLDISYRDNLNKHYEKDSAKGYTSIGPQAADVHFSVGREALPAKMLFSRGQKKVFFFLLKLAQGIYLSTQTQKQCIYLIDDLSAELDRVHTEALMEKLLSVKAQLFISCIHPEDIALSLPADRKHFALRGGVISCER